jgi:two-component system nitrate/nitrite response regulator NarL
VVLTAAVEQKEVVEALRLGARGLVLKESSTAILIQAIRVVANGLYWVRGKSLSDVLHLLLSPAPSPVARKHPGLFGLTGRELQIVHAVMAACGNKEIAETLSISEKTVKHHLTNIFDKTGVSSRLELALFALHHGIEPAG